MNTLYVNRSVRFAAAAALSCALVLSPLSALAASSTGGSDSSSTGCTGTSCEVKNPLKATTFPALIKDILNGILLVATPIIVLFIVYSGFLFVTAQGNTEQLSKARTNFMWVIIGSVVLLGAYAIAQIISATITSFTG